MRALFARLARASMTAETIPLFGESGTGKEVLARAIHDASPRRGQPFVVFHCSAVTPTLLEAELFGHAAPTPGPSRRGTGSSKRSEEDAILIDGNCRCR